MQWRQWLSDWGLPVPASPNLGMILVALVLVAGAYWIGWFAGGRAGRPLAAAIVRWTGRVEGISAALIGSIVHYSLVAMLLVVIGNTGLALSPIALMIVAVALGAAVAMLVFRIGRAAGLGTATGGIIATIALIAATAGTLGGMKPLVAGLDGVGFSVGTRRISALGALNFVVVVAVLFVLARVANRILTHSIGKVRALDLSQRVLAQKLAGIGVVVAAFLLGIDLLGIDLTALTVFSGALGLAVGFGLQKTLGNLIAGLILLMDRSVKPGDVIVVGDTFGAVSKIGIRAVSVVTRDGKEHLIPNEQLMTEPVENWSYSSRNVRVHIPVGVAYSSDLALAQRLMVEAATASRRVLTDPKPSVWLKGFGDNSVDHDVLVWIADPEAGVGNVRSDILNRLWVLFADNGVELPFPQRDVHIRSLPVSPSVPASDNEPPGAAGRAATRSAPNSEG